MLQTKNLDLSAFGLLTLSNVPLSSILCAQTCLTFDDPARLTTPPVTSDAGVPNPGDDPVNVEDQEDSAGGISPGYVREDPEEGIGHH